MWGDDRQRAGKEGNLEWPVGNNADRARGCQRGEKQVGCKGEEDALRKEAASG